MHQYLKAVSELSCRKFPLAKYCRLFRTCKNSILDTVSFPGSSWAVPEGCLNSICNWVQKYFVVYIVIQNNPLYKYVAQLSADRVSNVEIILGRLIWSVFVTKVTEYISGLFVSLLFLSQGLSWRCRRRVFLGAVCRRTGRAQTDTRCLIYCRVLKKRPRLRTHSGLFCVNNKPRQTKSRKVQYKVDILNLVTEPRDEQSSYNPQQILPTVIKTLS